MPIKPDNMEIEIGNTLINLSGIVVGLATFLIIGCCHPIVIKAEYHFGKGCWWAFLIAGVLFTVWSFFIENLVGATITGVTAFSCFWSILELFEQEKRVERGWFPSNPKKSGRKRQAADTKDNEEKGN